MTHTRALVTRLLTALVAALILLGVTTAADAHCDGLDGPVVQAARAALDAKNVNLVLIWVQPEEEAEIRNAFDHTLAVRGLNAEARDLADRYFFETLVRIHRAGEGAPYTGLKPAGRDLGPAIPAVDKAVETGSGKDMLHLLNEAVHSGVHARFTETISKRDFDPNDVAAGRDYVRAYVELVHYVKGIHDATGAAVHGHFPNAMHVD